MFYQTMCTAFFLLVLGLAPNAYSQTTNIDTLINNSVQAIEKQKNNAACLQQIQSLRSRADFNTAHDTSQYLIYYKLAVYNHRLNNHQDAINFIDTTLQYNHSTKVGSIAKSYSLRAFCNEKLDEFSQAKEDIDTAIKYERKAKYLNKRDIVEIYRAAGNIF